MIQQTKRMNKSEPSTGEQQHVLLRSLYTVIIFLSHLSMGLVTGVSGPAMVDLRYLMGNVSKKEPLSMADISLQSTFLVVGATIGGFFSFAYKLTLLSPYLNRQFAISILLLLSGASIAYTSQIRFVFLYYGLSVIAGIGIGNSIAIVITWLIEMWTGRLLAAILQALQLCYAIGTILGPLLIRPHLHGYMNATQVKTMNVTVYQELIDQRRASLTGPFIIIGGILGLVGILQLILYLSVCFRYRKASNSSETSPGSSVKLFECPQTRTQLYLFLILILLIFAGNNCAEVAYTTFQDTFLQSLSSIKITASQAAGIASITAASYTVGRCLSILICLILSSGNILLLHYALALSAFVCLLFSTNGNSLLLIRLNSGLIGYSFSAIIPAMFAYINVYSNVDDGRNALFSLALSLPSVFTPLLIGHYIEWLPDILVYIVLSVLGLSAVFFLIVRYWLVSKTKAIPIGSCNCT